MKAALDNYIVRLVNASQTHYLSVIACAILLAAAAGWYTAGHVGINTDTEEMLSEELPWRIAYADFKQAFPFFSDTIIVVVDAATPDLAQEASARLSAALRAERDHFESVFNPREEDFFRVSQFLYLAADELETLATRLNGAQALLGRLAATPDLAGLIDLLGDIAARDEEQLPPQADRFMTAVSTAVEGQFGGNGLPMSWQTLLSGADVSASQRIIFTVQPHLDFTSILSGGQALNALRATIARLGYADHPAVSVRLTGGAALAFDEMSSVIRGAERAGLLAFALIALCLIIGLRSPGLIIATLLTLLVGLILTATFAALAVGTLNMISVAFAVLYVGLGVDFAIHLSLRYRELCAVHGRVEALNAAAGHIGGSIALCALTTAIAFFAFIPTAYRGVAELGLISGAGMFVGLFTSFTLLPALLRALPAPRVTAAAQGVVPDHSSNTPRHTRTVLMFAAGSAVAACFSLSHARFDINPLHLNDPNAESVTTIVDLAGDGKQPLYAISLLAKNHARALETARDLEQLESVSNVVSADDLVPAGQTVKLELIEDLRWTLGSSLVLSEPRALQSDDIRAQLNALLETLPTGGAEDSAGPARMRLAQALGKFVRHLDTLGDAAARSALVQLEDTLMHHFPAQIARLQDALEAGPVTLENLPDDVRQRWISGDGRYRLEINPRADLNDNAALAQFADSVRSIVGDRATGTPVINVEASRAVIAAFYQAFATAGILIIILLWRILRRPAEVLIVLAPLLLAGLLTTAFAVLVDIPFNFANIIALPLLMGIGVDSALHILHRYKSPGADTRPLLQTSTARAVLFSALTTTASFGNLALSPHAGTASMGMMLSIGLAMTLVCTLVVMPALLHQFIMPTREQP